MLPEAQAHLVVGIPKVLTHADTMTHNQEELPRLENPVGRVLDHYVRHCVAGGILAIIPGRCSLCVWSPGLDNKGNSIAGIAALDTFTSLTGWSVF